MWQVADGRGHDTIYCWTDKGHVTRVRDALGNKRDSSYTPNGDVKSYTDMAGTAGAGTYSYSYASDGTNNLTGGESPDHVKFSVGYCSSGTTGCTSTGQAPYQAKHVQSANKGAQDMTYTSAGDLETVSSAGAAQSAITLDHTNPDGPDDGRLFGVTDARGNKTTFGYDSNRDLTEIKPPGSSLGKTRLHHDDLSRIDSRRPTGTCSEARTRATPQTRMGVISLAWSTMR
jgi:YD repeat-containing protein